MAQMTVSDTEGVFTFINVWTLPAPENQIQLLAQMKTEEVAMAPLHGFVSMVLLPSLDGRSLAVYAQWESQAHFDAAITNSPHAHASRLAMAKWGTYTADTFRVDAIFGANTPG